MDFAVQELLRPGALEPFRLKVAGRVLASVVWVVGRFRRAIRQFRLSNTRAIVQKGGLYFLSAAPDVPVPE
jgi:hypothetical protein